ETYPGRDAGRRVPAGRIRRGIAEPIGAVLPRSGRRVLGGRIRRGIAEPIGAVLWYSDLRGFTRITDQAPPQQVIPLLNDYAEAVISAVHDSGGDVLKLIGDGTLAIVTAGSTEEACPCAIEP